MAHHLPADITIEILSRIPVKSLLRFRCVSKPWLALVDHDANFARLHLNTFNKKNKSDETHLLVIENGIESIDHNQLDCVIRCCDTFKTISEIPFSLLQWQFVSFVDGMVLVKSNICGTTNTLSMLWNPSLRQFHNVPLLLLPFGHISEIIHIGLGYDPLAKDYKLVKLIYTTEERPLLCSVGIYTVGARSWKIIPIQKNSFNWCSNSCLTNSVYLQGSLYFIATDKQINGVWNLVSFDLSKEVLSSVPMYDTRFESLNYMYEKKFALIDGRFYVLVDEIHSHDKSIWVIERETMNWTKYYSSNIPLYVKKNGDLLTCKRYEQQVASYNPKTHEYQILQRRAGRIEHVSAYVESLFLHQCNKRKRGQTF